MNKLKNTIRSCDPASLKNTYVITFKDQKRHVETHQRDQITAPVLPNRMLDKEPYRAWDLIDEHFSCTCDDNFISQLQSWSQSQIMSTLPHIMWNLTAISLRDPPSFRKIGLGRLRMTWKKFAKHGLIPLSPWTLSYGSSSSRCWGRHMCWNIPKEPRDFGMVARLTATCQCTSLERTWFYFGPSARRSRFQASSIKVNLVTLLGVNSLTAIFSCIIRGAISTIVRLNWAM